MICDYQIIRTSSQGNAVVLDKSILIDCGVPFKALSSCFHGLRLVLLTHIHSDHFNRTTLRSLARERPTLRFGCGPWLVEALAECVGKEQIDVLTPGYKFDYGFCCVYPVKLSHDVPNCGYKVHFPSSKVFYATDTGDLRGIEARNYDLYLVEANHGTEEIRQRIRDKKADGIFPYERRAMENHLSVEQCNNFIYSNIGPGGEYVYLHAHLEENGRDGGCSPS